MENPQLEDMNSFYGNIGADRTGIPQSTNTKSDNFTVQMDRFSHFTSKNVSPSSRITLQRNLSRKGSYRGGEKQMNLNAENENDGTNFVSKSPSPKVAAQLVGASTPEKPIPVTVGATNHPFNQQIHHQITITTQATTTAAPAGTKHGGKRYSFKRSSSFTIEPRRILLLFATLSSMGTILLIYLTLSMNNVGGWGANNRD